MSTNQLRRTQIYFHYEPKSYILKKETDSMVETSIGDASNFVNKNDKKVCSISVAQAQTKLTAETKPLGGGGGLQQICHKRFF